MSSTTTTSVIRRLFTQPRRSCPTLLCPRWTDNCVCQKASYDDALMLTQISAAMVPASSSAAPPVSPVDRLRIGVRTYLCHGVPTSASVTPASPGEEGGQSRRYSRGDPLPIDRVGGDRSVARVAHVEALDGDDRTV